MAVIKTTHWAFVQILRIEISLQRHIGPNRRTGCYWINGPVDANHLVAQESLLGQRMTTSLGEKGLKTRNDQSRPIIL